MNKIEFFRNPINHLWIAHAMQRFGGVDIRHVYASGRTIDLLKHNIKQNIFNAKAGSYDSYVWDKNASEEIDLRFASKEFRSRYIDALVPPAPRAARKADLKNICFKEPEPKRVAVAISDKTVFSVAVGEDLVLYEIKEIARYKRFKHEDALAAALNQ